MSKKIVVLQIVNLFYSGGIREFLMNYYKKLDRDQIKFIFLVQRDYEIEEDKEIIKLGGEIVYGPRMYKNEINYYCFLKKYLKSNNIDIIHSHLNLRNFIPLFVAKNVGIKKRISHCHKNELNENKINKLKRFFIRIITLYCSTTLCACSKKAGYYMYGDKDVIIINNAIDLNEFFFNENLRKKYRIENKFTGKYVIGHVGNFSFEKNQIFLIDIFAEVLKQRDNSILVLIGDGEKINEVKDKVIKLNLNGKVIFMGTRKDVKYLYNSFDAFVFPSKSEGFGMAILEAECNGLDVIVSSEICSEACVNGFYQNVSLKRNQSFWAETILNLKCKRRGLSDDEKNAFKKFDINNNVKILEDLYKNKALENS